MAKKVRKWFDETQGRKEDLQYRFTVKESQLFCHNFARLLTFLRQVGQKKQRQVVLALAYFGLRQRDLCSIFNRFKLEETYVEQLQSAA